MTDPHSEQIPAGSLYLLAFCRAMRLAYFVALGLVLLAGCGGPGFPTTTLEGELTVDGQPIPEGTISFTAVSGKRGGGKPAQVTAGKYRAEGVPQGRVRVFFNAVKPTGRTFEQFGQQVPEDVTLIPPSLSSGIEIDVQGETMKHDFHLTSQGPADRPWAGK